MNHGLLLSRYGPGTHYLYCETEDIALRLNIDRNMAEVWLKHRGKREFRAAFDSRRAGLIFDHNPIIITLEAYYEFK